MKKCWIYPYKIDWIEKLIPTSLHEEDALHQHDQARMIIISSLLMLGIYCGIGLLFLTMPYYVGLVLCTYIFTMLSLSL